MLDLNVQDRHVELTFDYLCDFFKLNGEEIQEIFSKKLQNHDFNVFKVKELTDSQELITTLGFILLQEDCFTELPLKFDTFIRFATKISKGYNQKVPYHNQTHGADVAQVGLECM